MNHDIKLGEVGIPSIEKWALLAVLFPPVASAQVDTAKLQRQIEELSAKLESIQMRVVSEPRNVQFANIEQSSSRGVARERSISPKTARGRNQETRTTGIQSFLLNPPRDTQHRGGQCDVRWIRLCEKHSVHLIPGWLPINGETPNNTSSIENNKCRIIDQTTTDSTSEERREEECNLISNRGSRGAGGGYNNFEGQATRFVTNFD